MITKAQIDQISLDLLAIMGQSDSFDALQPAIQNELGKMKAALCTCGCTRPQSCGTCRTEVEDGLYWSEKADELIQELYDEDRTTDTEAL